MSDVVNVYMGNDIQIGSLSIENHSKILDKAKKNIHLYIMQAANFVTVFVNCYAHTLKLFVFAMLLFNVLYYFNGDPFIPSVVDSIERILTGRPDEASYLIVKVFLYSTLKMFIKMLAGGALLSLFMSTITTLHIALDFIYAQKRGSERKGYIFGCRNYFMEFVDNEIKKLLQEQSEGVVWVVQRENKAGQIPVQI